MSAFTQTFKETLSVTDTPIANFPGFAGRYFDQAPFGGMSIDTKAGYFITALGKTFVEAITLSEVFSAITSLNRAFVDTLTTAETFARSAGKNIVDFLNFIDSPDNDNMWIGGNYLAQVPLAGVTLDLTNMYFTFALGKALSDSITFTDIFAKTITWFKLFIESITLTESYVTAKARSFLDILTTVEVFITNQGRVLSDGFTLSDTFLPAITRTFLETLTLVETFVITTSKLFVDTFSLAEVFVTNTGRLFVETLTLADSFLHAIGKTFVDFLTLTENYVNARFKLLYDKINFLDSEFCFAAPLGVELLGFAELGAAAIACVQLFKLIFTHKEINLLPEIMVTSIFNDIVIGGIKDDSITGTLRDDTLDALIK